MGSNCSLVFYRGTLLSPADLSQIFRRIAGPQLTTATLAIGHAEHVFMPPQRRGEALWPVHALFAFEKPLAGSDTGRVLAGTDDPSLSDRVRAVWRVVAKSGLPAEWLIEIAMEISRLRERSLWATASEDATIGGYALCEHGNIVESNSIAEDGVDGPDRALERFAGVKSARVQDAFDRAAADAARSTSFALFTEDGQFLDPPRRVSAGDLVGFEVLR
jgi:hypothetical protein